jgi:N-carbamoylputrescine amidase
MSAVRLLRIAGIQVESRNGDVAGNLGRAEALVSVAAARGAELVLSPELLAAGYIYDRSLWDAAEPRGSGATEQWLSRMARQHRLYIGATYLEACGDDFFNTFTLMKPDGTAAGRVRKESLPGFEGWFFRSCPGPKVIVTEFGRIGVGICWDNDTAQFFCRVTADDVDLLLMPHSAPRIAMGPLTLVGERGRQRLRDVAGFYARHFGVPTVMVHKAAGPESRSPVPCVPLVRFRFHNFGQSTICHASGNLSDQLDEQSGVVLGEVALDAARKRRPTEVPRGYWSRPPGLFPRTVGAVFQLFERMGRTAYALSRSRRAAARAHAARCRATASLIAEPGIEPR